MGPGPLCTGKIVPRVCPEVKRLRTSGLGRTVPGTLGWVRLADNHWSWLWMIFFWYWNDPGWLKTGRGMEAWDSERFKIFVKTWESSLARALITLPRIRSGPAAFLGFTLMNIQATSCACTVSGLELGADWGKGDVECKPLWRTLKAWKEQVQFLHQCSPGVRSYAGLTSEVGQLL